MTIWLDSPLLGFDTETTGVNPTSDRVVTAALVMRDRAGTRHRTWLIDPGVEIPEGATAIHGISTERARAEGQAPAVALEEIAGYITQAISHRIPVVAFNAGFDLQILDSDLARHGLPTLPQRLGGPVRPVIDPLVLDRAVDRYRKGKRTLSHLCEVYGVKPERLHTAEVDVVATLDVLAALARRHGPVLAEMDLLQLHDYQVTAHRAWAQNFREWLASKGGAGGPELTWPY
ncbi:MAG TPA: exonuclease domain-containing protein [Actinomycetaceae bacterium]|nr:exonuclease domain-containing protein [Actinomycetaceae bacterium]